MKTIIYNQQIMLVARDERFIVIYTTDMISIRETAGLMTMWERFLKNTKIENPQVMGMITDLYVTTMCCG
jgi:hypothetical protein